MKFTEMLEELKKGEKVTREEWEKIKTYRYKYIKFEHGDCVAYLKDGYPRHKGEELTTWVGCVFGCADFTAEDWKIYHENLTQSWKPQRDETYYSIDRCGRIFETNNVEYDTDKRAIRFGNCFKTKEKAEHMLQKIRIIIQLRKLSNISFNDNCKQEKFVIFYNTENQQIKITQHKFIREIPFNIYFKNKKDCQKAIETIGEDNLKKYYFDVED